MSLGMESVLWEFFAQASIFFLLSLYLMYVLYPRLARKHTTIPIISNISAVPKNFMTNDVLSIFFTSCHGERLNDRNIIMDIYTKVNKK